MSEVYTYERLQYAQVGNCHSLYEKVQVGNCHSLYEKVQVLNGELERMKGREADWREALKRASDLAVEVEAQRRKQVDTSVSLYDQVQVLNTTVAELKAECDKWEKAWFEELAAKAVAETNHHSYHEWWAQEQAKNVALQQRVRELEEANAWMEKDAGVG